MSANVLSLYLPDAGAINLYNKWPLFCIFK